MWDAHHVKGSFVFGYFGHEFQITKTPPYQFLFISDFDLMWANYTGEWI